MQWQNEDGQERLKRKSGVIKRSAIFSLVAGLVKCNILVKASSIINDVIDIESSASMEILPDKPC